MIDSFELRQGKFGMFFYSVRNDQSVPLNDVLLTLNAMGEAGDVLRGTSAGFTISRIIDRRVQEMLKMEKIEKILKE